MRTIKPTPWQQYTSVYRGDAFLDQIWNDSRLQDAYESSADVGPNLCSSDHKTVFLRTRNYYTLKSYHVVKIRDYKTSNLRSYCEILAKADFAVIDEEVDINKKCHLYYQLLQLADSLISSEYVVTAYNDKPCITSILKLLVNKRWQAYRRRDWSLYNHYKAKAKIEITKAKTA